MKDEEDEEEVFCFEVEKKISSRKLFIQLSEER